MIKKIHILILLSILALGGCATGGFSPDVVSRDAAAKSQYVQSGVVVSVRNVTIEGDRDSGICLGQFSVPLLGQT